MHLSSCETDGTNNKASDWWRYVVRKIHLKLYSALIDVIFTSIPFDSDANEEKIERCILHDNSATAIALTFFFSNVAILLMWASETEDTWSYQAAHALYCIKSKVLPDERLCLIAGKTQRKNKAHWPICRISELEGSGLESVCRTRWAAESSRSKYDRAELLWIIIFSNFVFSWEKKQ